MRPETPGPEETARNGGTRRLALPVAPNPEAVERLRLALEVPAAIARVLVSRGLANVADAKAFLSPDPSGLHDPFLLAGIPQAVEKLAATARSGGRVVVFGDYDCDGVGAVAILTTVLRRLGADARAFIPHRIHDGYGLKPAVMARALAEHEPDGLVTVDCGITAVDSVAEALDRGLYVIVTDHHLPPSALPQGGILIDPKLPGCTYPFKDLCGAGISWKLCEALLIATGEAAGIGPQKRLSWLASLAKIAALSTIADMVPLTGENRILASWGLAGLADPRSPGLTALLARSAISPGCPPSAREVAFRIAPRLNAAGRIDHAYRSLELLTTTDKSRADALAEEIELANTERRSMQARLVEVVLKRIAKTFSAERDGIVIEAGEVAEGWHRGILGIAASRVAAEVRRPVLLLSWDGEWVSGSGRTYGKTPLFERLAPVARRHARDFGGHEAALGLTLPASSYDAFREEAGRVFADGGDPEEWIEEIRIDSLLLASEVNRELVHSLQKFEPHGMQNPRPVFLLRGLTWDGAARSVGESGLRFTLRHESLRLDAVGWELAATPPEARRGTFDVAAQVSLDAYTGRPSISVLDLFPSSNPSLERATCS